MGFSPANLLFFLWAMTATVSGVVVDETGRPVADAEVRLSPNRGDVASSWEAEAGIVRVRTSAEGRFRLERVVPGRLFDLVVARPGFAPSLRAFAVPESRSLPPLRITLRRGRMVFGTLVDGAGRPAAGAKVELVRSESVAPQASGAAPLDWGLHQAATGPDGRFTIPDLPTGRFDLDALGPAFRWRLAEALAVTPGTEPLHLGSFLLERGVLEGRVRDAEGRPVAGAEVWLPPEGSNPTWWSLDFDAEEPAVLTGPDGRFEIPELPAQGWNSLVVCRKGFASAREFPDLGKPVEVVLSPVIPLSGRVVGPRGEPLAGVRVWALSRDPWIALAASGPCPPEPSSSDAEGRFTLAIAEPGWYSVTAEAEGFLGGRLDQVGVPSDKDLLLTLEPGVTVEGRVLDPEGEPIPRAGVGIYAGGRSPESVSGPDGSYRLMGVEPGQRLLKAEHGDYSKEVWEIEVSAEGKRFDVVLERLPRHEIRGRVLGPDGEAVEGARVTTAAGLWTMTEADGSFLLQTTKPDDPWLRAEKEGYGAVRAKLPPPPVSGLEIRLARSVSLTGQILGRAPEELERAVVYATSKGDDSERWGIVDSEGRYRVPDLAPGEWMVNAQAGGFLSLDESVTVPPDVPEVVHDLVFPPLFEVRGQVTGPEGEPLARAKVSSMRMSRSDWLGTETRADGSFSIRLEEGNYEVTVSLEGYYGGEAGRIVHVAGAPVDGVDFQLQRGAVLTGRVLGVEPGEGPVQLTPWAPNGSSSCCVVTDVNGSYRISGLAPGTWKITAVFSTPGRLQRKGEGSITLSPGETEAFLDIELTIDPDEPEEP